MIIFGIDPGISGAISILKNKKVLEVYDMPTMIDGKKIKNKSMVHRSQIFSKRELIPKMKLLLSLSMLMQCLDKV